MIFHDNRNQFLCRCTGDDAVNVGGAASPIFVNCQLRAKKCGVRVFGTGNPVFVDCYIRECGEQAAKAFDTSSPTFVRFAFP